MIDRTTCTI